MVIGGSAYALPPAYANLANASSYQLETSSITTGPSVRVSQRTVGVPMVTTTATTAYPTTAYPTTAYPTTGYPMQTSMTTAERFPITTATTSVNPMTASTAGFHLERTGTSPYAVPVTAATYAATGVSQSHQVLSHQTALSDPTNPWKTTNYCGPLTKTSPLAAMAIETVGVTNVPTSVASRSIATTYGTTQVRTSQSGITTTVPNTYVATQYPTVVVTTGGSRNVNVTGMPGYSQMQVPSSVTTRSIEPIGTASCYQPAVTHRQVVASPNATYTSGAYQRPASATMPAIQQYSGNAGPVYTTTTTTACAYPYSMNQAHGVPSHNTYGNTSHRRVEIASQDHRSRPSGHSVSCHARNASAADQLRYSGGTHTTVTTTNTTSSTSAPLHGTMTSVYPTKYDSEYTQALGQLGRFQQRKKGACSGINACFCGACDRGVGCCGCCNRKGCCDRPGAVPVNVLVPVIKKKAKAKKEKKPKKAKAPKAPKAGKKGKKC